MPYDAPGRADELTDELRTRWNEAVQRAYDTQAARLKTRFFSLDPGALRNPRRSDAIKWPGDRGKPAYCVGEEMARELANWGLTGCRAVQLEYCEYLTVQARDETGAQRPKRVEVTTEFREWWSCVATYDPERVRAMATEVLGFEPSWEDLYGVADPQAMAPAAREIAFGHACAGHGNDRRLRAAGVPAQPTGRLNMERALFMTHPINGIDDLVYVVLFGAHAYAVGEGAGRRRANGDDIFSAFAVAHLACNHSGAAGSTSTTAVEPAQRRPRGGHQDRRRRRRGLGRRRDVPRVPAPRGRPRRLAAPDAHRPGAGGRARQAVGLPDHRRRGRRRAADRRRLPGQRHADLAERERRGLRRAAGGRGRAGARVARAARQPPPAPGERLGHAADLPPGL